jgi:hypothetical protein
MSTPEMNVQTQSVHFGSLDRQRRGSVHPPSDGAIIGGEPDPRIRREWVGPVEGPAVPDTKPCRHVKPDNVFGGCHVWKTEPGARARTQPSVPPSPSARHLQVSPTANAVAADARFVTEEGIAALDLGLARFHVARRPDVGSRR